MENIRKTDCGYVLENARAQIAIHHADSCVLLVIDKATGENIRGEETPFFALLDEAKNLIVPTAVTLQFKLN